MNRIAMDKSAGASRDEDCPDCKKREFNLNPEAVAALVDQIPISPEFRVDEEVLAKRLAVCFTCDAAREGILCAHCGCFIRFRIRSSKAYCPHPAGEKWPSLNQETSP